MGLSFFPSFGLSAHHNEKLFEGSRLGDAFLTDFPVREKQDGAECWTLIPVLLLRLRS